MARSTVAVKFTADTADLKRGLGDVDAQASKFGDGAQKSFGKVSLGAAAVGVGVLAMGKSFVSAAEESQQVTKQTEAVLKSMGDAAGVTADDVASLSDELSKKSGIDDEVIASGQNLLLTFGKVRNEVGQGNDVFTRATKAALDMSVAMGTDLQGATIMVGKALNDPIKGITAMTRAGVSFTEQQKDQIKTMVAAGDTLGAQKLIMAELEKQFGGSAEAQATASAKLSVAFGNLQEQIGGLLLPAFETLADVGGDVIGMFEALPAPIQSTVVQGAALVGGLLAIGGTVSFAVTHLRNMKTNLGGLVPDLKNAEGGLTGVGRAAAGMGIAAAAVAGVVGLKALIDAANETKVDVDELAASTANLTGAQREQLAQALLVASQWGDLDDIVSKTADTNVVAAQRLIEVAEAAGIGSEEIAKLRGIVEEKQAADVQGAVDQKTNSDAIRDGAAAADEQSGSLQSLSDQMRAMFDPLFAAQSAQKALTEAQAKATEAVKEHGAASAEAVAANDAAVAAAYRFEGSLMALQTAVENGDVSLDESRATLQQWVRDGVITEDQAKQAAAAFDAVSRKADALNGKRVTVTIVTKEEFMGKGSAAYEREHRAAGAPVGGRASGGPVRKGLPYIVGEERPELFVPDQNGTIIPSVPATATAGGYGMASTTQPAVIVLQLDGRELGRVTIDNLLALGKSDGIQYLNAG